MPATEEYDITQPYLGLINKYRPKPNEVDMDTQRRLAKGNATAEAFRLLIDAVGGSKGANIQERKEPANAVAGAVDKYYKLKDANKAEQDSWDKMELGAGLDALKTKAGQEYDTEKTNKAQTFAKEQADTAYTRQSTEKALDRKQSGENNAATNKRYEILYGNNAAAKKEDQNIKREGLSIQRDKLSSASDNKSFEKSYSNGTFKGFSITDESIGRTFGLPTTNIPQALAFMQEDPAVKAEIGMIRASYDNLGTTAEVNSMVARAFKKLSPETQDKIWALSSGSVPFNVNTEQQAQPNSPLLPQANSPLPYTPGKGPLMAPQTPTIKTDKNSTMVKVEGQPEPQQAHATPEQMSYLKNVINTEGYTPEIKREAVYNYLVKQGYTSDNAKSVAEQTYQALTRN